MSICINLYVASVYFTIDITNIPVGHNYHYQTTDLTHTPTDPHSVMELLLLVTGENLKQDAYAQVE